MKTASTPGRTLGTVALASVVLAGAATAQQAARPAPSVPKNGQAGIVLPLTLAAAVAGALENNEGIVIERTFLDGAAAAVTGAQGGYDPVLAVDAGWRRTAAPADSVFSGAETGQAELTDESAETRASIRRLLPTGGTLALRTGAARRETDGAFALLSPAWDSTVGVELRQPLLRGRAIDPVRLELRVAAADRARARAALRREVIATVARVERAYWTLLAARRAIVVQEESVELAAEQLEQTELRIEGGVAPETEIAQPRSELARRRGELLEAHEAAARAENALKLEILGDDDPGLWAATLEPTEEVEVEVAPVDVAGALADAVDSRPELDAAEAEVARRRAETAFAGDGVRPDLDVVVSYDRFGLAGSRNPAGQPLPGQPDDLPPGLEGDLGSSLEQLANGDLEDARVAVLFEVPLGRRAARASSRIARSAERRAEASLALLRKAVRSEVLDAAATLDTASQRIDAARAAREAAEVQLDAERERYGVGQSTNFLVLTRQNDLAAARLNEIEALTDYRVALVEIGRATGRLLERRGIVVEESP